VNFKKMLIALLIGLAIVGMVSVNAVDATWVAHRGKYFKTGDYLATAEAEVGGKWYQLNQGSGFWTQEKDCGLYTLLPDEWTDVLRELEKKGYCNCIYYNGKKKTVYVFTNKTMAPGEYYEKYFETCWARPDYRVRISVNNDKTSWF